MLTREFVKAVADQANAPVEVVRGVMSAMQSVTMGQLRAAGEVRVPGLVSLRFTERSARMGRNVKTGEPAPIEAGLTVKAKPIKALVDFANEQVQKVVVAT